MNNVEGELSKSATTEDSSVTASAGKIFLLSITPSMP